VAGQNVARAKVHSHVRYALTHVTNLCRVSPCQANRQTFKSLGVEYTLELPEKWVQLSIGRTECARTSAQAMMGLSSHIELRQCTVMPNDVVWQLRSQSRIPAQNDWSISTSHYKCW
jgi:hypothetical protein